MARSGKWAFLELSIEMREIAQDLGDAIDDEMDGEAKNLHDDIKDNIKAKGLVDTRNLLNSVEFEARGKTGSVWWITIDADYAMALEEGAKPHPIYPKTGTRALTFIPEDQSLYPEETHWGDFVQLGGVEEHPGNRPYWYVRDAVTPWGNTLLRDLNSRINAFFISRGYKPAGGISI